jgi:hypothetical protein
VIVKKVPNSKTKHKTGSIRDLADYIREPHNQNPDEKCCTPTGAVSSVTATPHSVKKW